VIDSDDSLLQRMSRGEDIAFDYLFLRYYAPVYRVAYRLVGSREKAEDLAQETFLELYRNAPVLDRDPTLLPWLCRVVLNKGYNTLRGEKREQERVERWSVTPEQLDPVVEVLRSEEQAKVREVLRELPERQSELLMLRHAGLTYGEIASVIGVAPGSVGTLLVRAERTFLAAYKGQEKVEQTETESMKGTRPWQNA
jgi:RNA polymerase sigma-70 factor, ECF subfamily